MSKQNNLITGCLCALGCETIFGLSYMFTKNATESVSAFALLGWRFFVAMVVMSLCVLVGFIKINLREKDIKPLLLVALFSPCIYFIGETVGISHTTSSESGVFLACIPVVSILASALILKKEPSKMQILGILITLAGVTATVFAVGVTSSLSPVVFVLLAVIEAAVKGNVGELLVLPVKDRAFLTAILYHGIGCSIVAFFLSNVAIAKIGVNRTSSFIGVSTVVSIIAGALLLKESFSIYQIVGALVIIAGVYTANAGSTN